MNDAIERLEAMLAPQGILTVTTGGDEIGRLLQARYGSTDPDEVRRAWRAGLERIAGAKVVLIGVPMDAGAGFERGSFKGPLGIRSALVAGGAYPAMEAAGVVDVGDVRVNPHMVDDAYYAPEVLDAVREARGVDAPAVTPLSAFAAALDAIRELNPGAKVLHLGGDHSTSRVPVEWLARDPSAKPGELGILHFDAHTDLLAARDGVPHNFATWAYHANEVIGRGGRLVQLGVRVSGRSAKEWEQDMDLHQLRMDRLEGRLIEEVCEEVVGLLRDAGVKRVHVSNDIDGTDPVYAASTGTMEVGGMHPDLVSAVTLAVGEAFEVASADVVEVAPPLKWHVPGEPARTIRTACRYVVDQLEAMLGERVTDAFDVLEPATPEQVADVPPLF